MAVADVARARGVVLTLWKRPRDVVGDVGVVVPSPERLHAGIRHERHSMNDNGLSCFGLSVEVSSRM